MIFKDINFKKLIKTVYVYAYIELHAAHPTIIYERTYKNYLDNIFSLILLP